MHRETGVDDYHQKDTCKADHRGDDKRLTDGSDGGDEGKKGVIIGGQRVVRQIWLVPVIIIIDGGQCRVQSPAISQPVWSINQQGNRKAL